MNPPLHSSETEKRRLEHDAAKLFMRRYEKTFHAPIRDIIHNRPAKPDVSCHLDGQLLDLEIAHLYGSESEAQQILRGGLPADTLEALKELHAIRNTHNRLLHTLNSLLAKKAGKRYASSRVWLVIRNAHPAWHSEDINDLREHIQLPSAHPFEQIWVMGDFNGQSPLIRLY